MLVEILQLAIEVKYGGYIYIENLWEKMMLELQCLGKDHIFFITMEAWKFEGTNKNLLLYYMESLACLKLEIRLDNLTDMEWKANFLCIVLTCGARRREK